MTVIEIIDDGTNRIKVAYEDRSDWNKLKTELFPAAALKVYVALARKNTEADEDI